MACFAIYVFETNKHKMNNLHIYANVMSGCIAKADIWVSCMFANARSMSLVLDNMLNLFPFLRFFLFMYS